MARLQQAGTMPAGPEIYRPGTRDLLAAEGRLYAVALAEGKGVVLRDAASGQVTGQAPLNWGTGRDAAPGLLLAEGPGGPVLLVHGQAGGYLSSFALAADGQPGAERRLAGGDPAVSALVLAGDGAGMRLYSASESVGGIAAWRLGPDGLIAEGRTALGAGPGDVAALATVQAGAQEVLLAATLSGNALTTFRIGPDGGPVRAGSAAAPEGLQVAAPAALATAELDGRAWAFLAAAGTGSLSAVAVDPSGALTVTDQVNDTALTRFAGAAQVAALAVSGRVFVAVAGSDDGVSLLELLPGGRLLHRGSVADAPGLALDAVSALEIAATGTRIEVYAASGTEAGVTRLVYEAGPAGGHFTPADAGEILRGTVHGDVMTGGPGDDVLKGDDGDDVLTDGAGADALRGGTGADVFVFTADGLPDRILDFEPGTDRIDLSGWGRIHALSALEIAGTADGAVIRFGAERLEIATMDGTPLDPAALTLPDLVDLWHVPPATAPDPRLDAAEIVTGTAADEVLSGAPADPGFDADAALVFRLYGAVLGRASDPGGLMHWTGALAGGMTPPEMAGRLTRSAEFDLRYDAADDGDFVTLLYRNVLGREPDPEGFEHWTGRLSSGALTRGEAVLGFSESAENLDRSWAAALGTSRDGLRAAASAEVWRLYHAVLGRDPDASGFERWTGAIAHGMAREEVAARFTLSAEFDLRYDVADDGDFVTLLYRNVLGRDPDPGGFGHWTGRLSSGALTRAEVVLGFAESPENRNNTAADVTAWMRARGIDDRIAGGAGDDRLHGGAGADVFVFDLAHKGADRLAGFEAWDRLHLTGFGYETPAAALAHVTDGAAGAVFADRGVSVLLEGVAAAELGADAFWIG